MSGEDEGMRHLDGITWRNGETCGIYDHEAGEWVPMVPQRSDTAPQGPIRLRLDPTLRRRLTSEATRSGDTPSGVLRRLIDQHLPHDNQETPA